MKRPSLSILRGACALAVLMITACLVSGCGVSDDDTKAKASEVPDRPNVILILTDDQTLQDTEYMPNVQRLLAEEGTTFENAFVTDSLCCPSRATTLRGQYAHNHQVLGNELPLGGFKKFRFLGREKSTIATWLRDDGYRTALIGKYLNDYSGTYVPPGWDEWQAISGNYLSNDLNENGRIVTYDSERYHLDDVLAEKAASYIGSTSGDDRPFFMDDSPFFMWLGTKAPHQPATPAPRHEDEFTDLPLPNGPPFDEKDVSDKPEWIRDNPPLDGQRAAYMEELNRKRLQSLQAVDEMVVRLVRSLREAGELDDTYIFFMSDNGFHLGQHRLGAGKWTAYEEDIRIPLIVRGPGVPAGETRDHLVLNNDIAPTFADIAGAQTPPFVDGRSLLPLLTDDPPPEERWRQSFLVEAAAELAGVPAPPFVAESSVGPLLSGDPLPEDWRQAAKEGAWSSEDWGRPALQAVRTEDHLYVEYETGEQELYDLSEDPHELENLLGEGAVPNPGTTVLEERLEARLSALRGCAGAACRAAENGG